MADPLPDEEVNDETGVVACERFVRDCMEIDRAWLSGTLDEWVERKLADERRAAGFTD